MKPIEDHLREGLDIVFCGFNPSPKSSEAGHHYANRNNRFWTILHKAGITNRKYEASEDYLLLEVGYGFTNIVSRPTKAADEITKEEYKEGRKQLEQKIRYFKPKVVCFVGKGVYQEYTGKKSIPWGVQDEGVVTSTIDFVAPSSSGLVRMKLDAIVEIYNELTKIIKK